MTSRQTIWNRKLRRTLKKLYGNRCYFCSTKHNLQFAHVMPTSLSGMSRGSKERMRDVRNNTDKYLLTCRMHNNNAEIVK